MSSEQFPLTSEGAAQAKKGYTALENKHDEFSAAIESGDIERAKILKAELEQGMTALSERLISPLERELQLKEQYDRQVNILGSCGITEQMRAKGYEIPSYSQIRSAFRAEQELLTTKAEQGFKTFLLVPFGMSIADLTKIYGDALKKHKTENKLFAEADPAVPYDLNVEKPVDAWTGYQTEEISYFSKQFDQTNHGGLTKAQVIQESGAWQAVLIEDIPIPRAGVGATLGTKKPRKQLEAKKSPNAYLELLKDPQYEGEEGLTPELWLYKALTRLEEQNQVTDDWQGKGSISYNLGAYFPKSANVASADWSRGSSQAYLGRSDAGNVASSYGASSAVRVKVPKT